MRYFSKAKYFVFFLLFFSIFACENNEYSLNELTTNSLTRSGLEGDSCSSTFQTITGSMTVTGDTTSYADSLIAPKSCSDTYSADKIYKLSLTKTQKIVAKMDSDDFDSVLYIKRDCLSDAISCNDDDGNDYNSKLTTILPAGDYFLVVDGYGRGSVGNFSLRVDFLSAVGESCSDIVCAENYSCELSNNTPTCVCSGNNCETTSELTAGDIILTEIMPNPAGSDRYNEWIEIYNTTNREILLDNLKVTRDRSTFTLSSKGLKIAPHSYFTIAKNRRANIPDIDAVMSISLTNSGTHDLSIQLDGVLLDEIRYSSISSGKSKQLDINRYGNSTFSDWCNSRATISTENSDKGTPKLENVSCADPCSHNCSNSGICNPVDGSCSCNDGYVGDTCNSCATGYTDNNGVCTPNLEQLLNHKDIIVTEFIPNPVGSDTTNEWLELYNRTDEAIDITNLKIKVDGTNKSFSGSYEIAANSYFLIGRSSSAAANVDAVISSMSLGNTGEHTIILEIGDLQLDMVTYDGSTEGKSYQLDNSKYNFTDFNSEFWCQKDATPNAENVSCIVDMCEDVNCNNGRCITYEGAALCICEAGFSGDSCEICDEGNPNCPQEMLAEEVIITEIMINPDGSDYNNEWIELYNTTGKTLIVDGLKIRKDLINYNVRGENLTIEPHSYFLIARSANDLFPNADAYCSFSFNNTGTHAISIISNERVIDTITYENSKSSSSFQIDTSFLNATDNDNINYWCDGTAPISDATTDKGTPKAENRGCGSCATLSCGINSHCVSDGDEASCVCNTGYHKDNEDFCAMDQQCGVLYDNVRDLTGEELKTALQQLTGVYFYSQGYNIDRKYMYRVIDNFDGKVQCVYTGRIANISPDPTVEIDSRWGDCNQRTCNCSNKGMNTEHTWPQSKFDKLEPMKSDLHHIFPTDACTNGQRSSWKFGNVQYPVGRFGNDDYGYSKLGNQIFEPADPHKGDVARAMFYFVTRYGNYSNYLDDEQEAVLRQWHHDDPVSDKERLRNNRIEKYQLNRNPFIDCPDMVDAIPNF